MWAYVDIQSPVLFGENPTLEISVHPFVWISFLMLVENFDHPIIEPFLILHHPISQSNLELIILDTLLDNDHKTNETIIDETQKLGISDKLIIIEINQ